MKNIYKAISVLVIFLQACSSPQQSTDSRSAADSAVSAKRFSASQIDSFVDVRLDYFIKQVGDTAKFEQFYGRKLEDMRKEYIKIYTDSLGKR